MNYTRRDVVFVNLGAVSKPNKPSKEIIGHEQGEKRPCIVIKEFDKLGLLIVVPCTSVQPKFSSFTIVKILQGAGGLKSDSYALCHQVRAISINRIIDKWGTLPDTDFGKIHAVLLDIHSDS